MERTFSELFFPMNFDASNVEDISIHHIKECLLLSCIASYEDWSNIFRTRSFTLCKNDLDFNERSDSVTVLESKKSSSMTNLFVCCVNKSAGCSLTSLPFLLPALHPISTLEKTTFHQYSILSSLMSKLPSQVSPFLVAAQSTSSEVFGFHVWFSPDFLMQWRQEHQESFRCIARLNSSSVSTLL